MLTGTFLDYINVISAIATSIAAFLIFWQISSDRRWDRMLASHEILNQFVSGEIENALERIEADLGWDILHEKRKYHQVVETLQTDKIDALDKYLRRLFRRFEAICISMDNNIIREDICKDYIFSILLTLYRNCDHFVIRERERRSEPKIFEYVELYARKWE
jgi:hypothetical protein